MSGIKLQGFNNKSFWVEAFKVSYSNDGHVWSTIKEKEFPSDRTFVGNFDSGTILSQYFDNLIFARYLKIHPTKWHQSIGMRLEIIGCSPSHSPASLSPTTSHTPAPTRVSEREPCEVCPGLPGDTPTDIACSCPAGLRWDGSECVEESLCPCYHNSMR